MNASLLERLSGDRVCVGQSLTSSARALATDGSKGNKQKAGPPHPVSQLLVSWLCHSVDIDSIGSSHATQLSAFWLV